MALSKAYANQGISDGGLYASYPTGSFDSSGSDFVVVFVKHEGAATTITVSDNKGTTFTPLTLISHSNGDVHGQLFYGTIGTPGSGHVVTANFAANKGYIAVCAWIVNSDTDTAIALDDESGAYGSGTSHDAGSLTTTAAAVSFLGIAGYALQTHTPGTGWTEDLDGASAGYCSFNSRTDGSATTIDPYATSDTSSDFCAVAASFKESGGGGGSSSLLANTRQRTNNLMRF